MRREGLEVSGVARALRQSHARPSEDQTSGSIAGFRLGLGDWAILALWIVLIVAAVAYWVVGLLAASM